MESVKRCSFIYHFLYIISAESYPSFEFHKTTGNSYLQGMPTYQSENMGKPKIMTSQRSKKLSTVLRRILSPLIGPPSQETWIQMEAGVSSTIPQRKQAPLSLLRHTKTAIPLTFAPETKENDNFRCRHPTETISPTSCQPFLSSGHR